TGAPQGEELGLIKPLSDSFFSCFDKSFIPEGASRLGARATGAAPASAVALGIYLAYVPYEEEFQYLSFILAILVPVIVLAIGVDLCLKN
nr:hypothetical protein [Tanacetum cinerariifolium]